MSRKDVAPSMGEFDEAPRPVSRGTMQPPTSSSSSAHHDLDSKLRSDSTIQPRCEPLSYAEDSAAAQAEPDDNTRPLSAPQCNTCGATTHGPVDCGQFSSASLAKRAQRLARLEPFARYALHRGVPSNAPICAEHRQRGLQNTPVGDLVDPDHPAAILQHRALMPMCGRCALNRYKEMGGSMMSFDTCVCAAEVFDDKYCLWCALERLCRITSCYIRDHRTVVFAPETPAGPLRPHDFITCECGRKPMTMNESMRICACCGGAVTVPLHALDGVTHLACLYGEGSRRIIGEEGGKLDIHLTGSIVECIAHPVYQFIPYAAKHLENALKANSERLSRAEGRISGNGQEQETNIREKWT